MPSPCPSVAEQPRFAEQSRKITAGEIKQNCQAALRRRWESAASTGLYAQLRPPPQHPPPLRRPSGAVAPPATLGPVDVYTVLDQCRRVGTVALRTVPNCIPNAKVLSASLVARLFSKGAWGTVSTPTQV